jgi:hypothetical protein
METEIQKQAEATKIAEREAKKNKVIMSKKEAQWLERVEGMNKV